MGQHLASSATVVFETETLNFEVVVKLTPALRVNDIDIIEILPTEMATANPNQITYQRSTSWLILQIFGYW